MWQVSILRVLPLWSAAIAVPLALLGWLSWRDRTANIALGIFAVYAIVMMIAAREDNFYWAMLFVPIFFIGLIFAPSALSTLIRQLFVLPRPIATPLV